MKINEQTVTVNEIYKAFIKLNDTQKVAVIEKAKKANANDDTIKGLQWLAALSSEKLQHQILRELYATEAYNKLISGKA